MKSFITLGPNLWRFIVTLLLNTLCVRAAKALVRLVDRQIPHSPLLAYYMSRDGTKPGYVVSDKRRLKPVSSATQIS